MLVERPFLREYPCAQQGSYLRHQQLLELQHAMEKLNQFPIENFRRYHEVQEDTARRWQPVTRFNTRMASSSSEPNSYINPSFGSEAPAYRNNRVSKRPVQRNFPKIKQEVAAFGPKHAAHARRFYQSKRTKPIQEFRQVMVPPFRPSYGPMQASCHKHTQITKGGYLLGEPVFNRSLKKTGLYTDSVMGQVAVPVTSQTYETVLKIAKISPRPSKKQPTKTKTSFGFGAKLLNHKVEQGDNFQDDECEIDLSNAPVFQMLCEISNTL